MINIYIAFCGGMIAGILICTLIVRIELYKLKKKYEK